jgi:hypothetical protein
LRSPHEIFFRLRQEVENSRLFLFSPTLSDASWQPSHLPPAAAIAAHLRGSDFARQVDAIAQKLLAGSIPILGLELTLTSPIAWRKDHLSGIESGTAYFRRLPYLDVKQVGDHKIIWELNRHQHLALLAMASLLTGDSRYSDEVARQLKSWLDDNPFLRGINWTSALEVAFRALSWIWILAWCGERLPHDLRTRLVGELYRHGLYLEHNLSVYFSPNTHLLGEAVVLHLLGRVFPDWPRSSAWEGHGSRIVEDQMSFQMQDDGVHFEQSTYYHVYAVDFFLLHRIFARRVPQAFDTRLKAAITYLRALHGTRWRIPFIGDDDGGRLFHPFGDRSAFGRATMATASLLYDNPAWMRDPADCEEQAIWWLGPRPAPAVAPAVSVRSCRFQASGMVVMTSQDVQVTVDAGPFGWAGAGHSHSDTLSLTLSAGEEEILIDAGTYTYVGDPEWRNWFRGSAAHNTIRIGRRDQAHPSGPFRWLDKPSVEIEEWQSTDERDDLTAICRYRDNVHRRRVVFRKRDLLLFIYDDVEAGEQIEQFWHFGARVVQSTASSWRIGERGHLLVSGSAAPKLMIGEEHGWRSRVLGRKETGPVLCLTSLEAAPTRFATVIDVSGRAEIHEDLLAAGALL